MKSKEIKKKRLFLFSLFFLLSSFVSPFAFGENQFSLGLAPSIEAPLGIEVFGPGLGAAVTFDWAFWSFAENFDLGVGVNGGFASLPVQTGDPLSLMEGSLGPFVKWRPLDRWAFRAGIAAGLYQYSRSGESAANFLVSLGLGAEYHLSPYFSLFADGSYSYRVFSSKPLPSLGAALGLRINLMEVMGGRSRVEVEKTQQYRVFPVSWAWYENNPVAAVTVYNGEPHTVTDISLSFFMESYMNQPWTFAHIPRLAPGESIEVPVTALFNEAIMNLTETMNANGTVRVEYRSLGTRKETVQAMQMPIFHRNTLSWDDDRRAAAFVSPRDSAARLFARYVAGAVEAQTAEGKLARGGAAGIPPNVLYAAALFEALRLYGITYVIVPATSYAKIAADESALDNVSYPYQALYYRGGDCSYLSILFCSMLEALDIESAFITIPGHIYLAFNVGDDSWRAGSSDIIEIDGRRWLPVEITIPAEGFTRAWRVGAREWRTAGAEAALYPIRECWKLYPPVTVPGSGDHPPEMPEWDAIINALVKEQAAML